MLLIVVHAGLPQITPCKPRSRIKRAMVHRATAKLSRFIRRQTLRTPQKPKFPAKTRTTSDPDRDGRELRAAMDLVAARPACGRGWGNRQDLADGLDPINISIARLCRRLSLERVIELHLGKIILTPCRESRWPSATRGSRVPEPWSDQPSRWARQHACRCPP